MAPFRTFLALTMALLVAGAGVSSSLCAWMCRGQVHKSCCCSHAKQEGVNRASCCTSEARAVDSIPPTTASLAQFDAPPPVLLQLAAPALTRVTVSALTSSTWSTDVPPPTGPPIQIRIRSLLI